MRDQLGAQIGDTNWETHWAHKLGDQLGTSWGHKLEDQLGEHAGGTMAQNGGPKGKPNGGPNRGPNGGPAGNSLWKPDREGSGCPESGTKRGTKRRTKGGTKRGTRRQLPLETGSGGQRLS